MYTHVSIYIELFEGSFIYFPTATIMEYSEEGVRLRKQLGTLRPIEIKNQNRSWETYDGDHDDDDDQYHGIHGIKGGEDDHEEPVSPVGRLFNEPNMNVHILAILGFNTRLDPNVVKANLPRTLLKHPRFSSLLVVDEQSSGKMKWVRTDVVDLDKHVIIPKMDLPIYNNMQSTDKLVEDYIYNLTKGSVDKSRPLWDLHILDVKTSMAENVGIFRIHHSLGDGISLMSLLLACMRQTSDPGALPTLPEKKINKDYKNKDTNSTRMFSKIFLELWWVFKLFWNSIVDVLMFLATALFLVKDSRTPIKGPPGSENNPRRIVFKMLSLEDIKLVKNAMNMTINDVGLGITQAGLSRYLNRRYGLEKKNSEGGTGEKVNNNLPEKIRLRSILFINIRPSPGIQVLADMMEKNTNAKWGNCLGYVLLPLTIGFREDPLDYVREAKSISDRKKHSLEALCSSCIAGLVFKLFGIRPATSLFRRLFTGTTLAFSNLVGPLEEIGFYGYPMAFLAATTYGQASELMVSLQSYMNKMTIALSVDENTIPDPHQLCEDIAESLELIKSTIKEKILVR